MQFFSYFAMFSTLVLDPRLKVFGERKVNELRAWFDSRLEDAIKAAEQEGKEEEEVRTIVATQGKVLFDC